MFLTPHPDAGSKKESPIGIETLAHPTNYQAPGMQRPAGLERSPEEWQRIEPILDRAIDLPESERTAYLIEACGSDMDLRREVVSLIRAINLAVDEEFLEALPEPPDPHLGQQIDHYRIEGLVGRGGMGVVYRARDLKLHRDVAVKFLSPRLRGDTEARDRFEREARAASAIRHENICEIYQIGQAGDDLYIVMPSYEGQTIADKLKEGGLFERSVARDILLQLAVGLKAAHADGVVHRDIKPSNIFVTRDGVVKLLDFGIARIEGRQHTGTGRLIGTEAYMAPEVLKGERAGPAADIWSAGVVLKEMLGESEGGLAASLGCLQLDPADRPNAAELLKKLQTHSRPKELLVPLFRAFAATAGLVGVVVATWLLALNVNYGSPPADKKVVLGQFDCKADSEWLDSCKGLLQLVVDRIEEMEGSRLVNSVWPIDDSSRPLVESDSGNLNLSVSIDLTGGYSYKARARGKGIIYHSVIHGTRSEGISQLANEVASAVVRTLGFKTETSRIFPDPLSNANAQRYLNAVGFLTSDLVPVEKSNKIISDLMMARLEAKRFPGVYRALCEAYQKAYRSQRSPTRRNDRDNYCDQSRRLDTSARGLTTAANYALTRGDSLDARQLFQQALEIRPIFLAAGIGLARTESDSRQATHNLEKLCSKRHEDYRCWLGFAEHALGRWNNLEPRAPSWLGDKVDQAFQRVEELAPRSSRVLSSLGTREYLRGDKNAALEFFDSADRMSRLNLRADKNLAAMIYRDGEYEIALHFYRILVDDLGDSDSAIYAAEAAYRSGMKAESKSRYRRIQKSVLQDLSEEPDNGGLHQQLAFATVRLEDDISVDDPIIQRAWNSVPSDPQGWMLTGLFDMLVILGRPNLILNKYDPDDPAFGWICEIRDRPADAKFYEGAKHTLDLVCENFKDEDKPGPVTKP